MLSSPFFFTFLGRLFYFRDLALWWEIKSEVAEVRSTLETNDNLEIAIVFTVWIRRIMYREYFMESAGVRYLRTSCWRIRNRTSGRSERVRFLIQKQGVRKYRTKHFPCGIVFSIYILRHSSFWRPFYFKSFKNAKICRFTLTAKWQRKRSIRFLVKTFVKNINDGEDMR